MTPADLVDALMARVDLQVMLKGETREGHYRTALREALEALVPLAENADSFRGLPDGRGVGIICDGQRVNDPAFVVGDLRRAAALLRGEPTGRMHCYRTQQRHMTTALERGSMQYRKKPIAIEAFQMTRARRDDNSEWPDWLHVAWNKDHGEGALFIDADDPKRERLVLGTLEGVHRVAWDDWIIRGVKDELYACKPDIFEATYEPA